MRFSNHNDRKTKAIPVVGPLVAVLMTMFVGGCEGTPAECAVSADCAAIEVCQQGLCVLDETVEPEPSPAVVPDAGPREPEVVEPEVVEPEVVEPEPTPVPPEPTPPVDAGPPCLDGDGDDRGENCALGPDCDDEDPAVWIQMIGYADGDADGVTQSDPTVLCTSGVLPEGFLADSSSPPDCNDEQDAEYVEMDLYPDADGDAAYAADTEVVCMGETIPDGYTDVAPLTPDCDDADPRRTPGNDEVCDALDNNCSGFADDGNVCQGGCVVSYGIDPLHPYFFCPGPVTWGQARDSCANGSYQLVVIDDAAENTFVSNRRAQISNADWWIGISDFASEGNFVWVDGTAPGFTFWNNGEPNNNDNEDCGEFRGVGWNDSRCNEGNNYICEANPQPFVP